MPTFEETHAGYRNMLRSMTLDATSPKPQEYWDSEFDRSVERIVANKGRYQEIERATGVPWWWIAAVHDRESSGDFRGVLHNGERIIGTGRKTSLVPAGRGPFNSWEEAAVDALRYKNLDDIDDWSPERAAYELERYNGFGYMREGIGINSPYLWAGSSHQQQGKFTADSKYTASAWDTQRGTIPLLKRLAEVDADVRKRFWARLEPVAPPVEPPVKPPVEPPVLPPAPLPELEAIVERVRQEAFLAGWNARAAAEAEAEAKAIADIPLPLLPTATRKRSPS